MAGVRCCAHRSRHDRLNYGVDLSHCGALQRHAEAGSAQWDPWAVPESIPQCPEACTPYHRYSIT